jgi:hypothetical protein
MSAVVEAYPVRKDCCPHCGQMKPIWTPRAIIDAAHEWTQTYGRAPTRSDWGRAQPGYPTHSTVYNVFGSWSRMLAAAGLRPVPRGVRWSDTAIINAFHDWVAEYGTWPTWINWARASSSHPSAETVRAHFGSWSAGQRAAGRASLQKAV